MNDSSVQMRRGLILLALQEQSPLPLTRPSLERRVGMFYVEDDKGFLQDLSYLEGKGLLTHKSEKFDGKTIHAYSITPEGTDLCQKTTTDPGVEFAS